ncbi:hypothetical protein [Mucilaginibacter celer]|uniref:hypothetical protein n=1 Tax=Mucilaginibacter celer TaxID=2305508 RepID=UPI0013CE4C72|nr:hypothetical protein [Mucilaginibacter celer]
MMYIAFSALSQQSRDGESRHNNDALNSNESLIRFKAYEAACEKYKDQIIEIQKYMPGWMPPFNR